MRRAGGPWAGARSSSLALPQPLLFGAIAAHLHLAPAAALVLGGVEEQPAAVRAPALLDPRQLGLTQQADGGERNRTENRFGGPRSGVPGPRIDAGDPPQARKAQRGGGGLGQPIDRTSGGRFAGRQGHADDVEKFAQFAGARVQAPRQVRTASEYAAQLLAAPLAYDLGVLRPGHDVAGGLQMLPAARAMPPTRRV